METVVIEVIAGLAIAFLSWLAGSFASKVKHYKIREEQEKAKAEMRHAALEETCKEMLRRALKEDCEYYTSQGFCSVEDKFEVQNIYKIYHEDLEGNGRGTRYYGTIMNLPDSK